MAAEGQRPNPRTAVFGSIWSRPARSDERQPLSREQIVAAAMQLADQHGLGGVSLRRIARVLGSGATSLSWHVGSKDDLYELMFDAALGGITLPETTRDWRADIRAIAVATHRVLRAHPWLVQLGIQPALGPNTRRYAEVTMTILARHGFDRRSRTEVMALLNNYLVGFAHRQAAWDRLRQRSGLTDQQWAQRLEEYLVAMQRDDPDLAADIESRLHLTSPQAFESGLEYLLDGIASRGHPGLSQPAG
jgi:AcrR family transcriptional regulator